MAYHFHRRVHRCCQHEKWWNLEGPRPLSSSIIFRKGQIATSIVVWGGIGPRGYCKKLIKFTEHVNSKTYIESQEKKKKNQIFEKISDVFGDR